MTGVIEHDGIRYCILPERPPSGVYWEGGPLFRDPIDGRGRMKGPGGYPIENTQPVRESDLWTKGDRLIAIKGWPVWPLSGDAMRLPSGLIDKVVAQSISTRLPDGKSVQVEVNWGALSLSRRYLLAELTTGVAVWPPRALSGWKRFFLLFSAGLEESIGKGTGIFSNLEPAVGSFTDGQPALTSAVVVANAMVGLAQTSMIPRWVGFRARGTSGDTDGVMPLVLDERGAFSIPASTRKKSTFAAEPAASAADDDRPLSMSVDFGTSNTDVAWTLEPSDPPVRFEPTSASLAGNLTLTLGLDAGVDREAALRFFPLRTPLPMPLPTILLDFPAYSWPDGSDLFVQRSIPGLRLNESVVRALARTGRLKQDFKWKRSPDAASDRKSFLEQLGLLMAWELRAGEGTARRRKVDLVFTCPLAFDSAQTENLQASIAGFQNALQSGGLQVNTTETMSESLANFYFVRGKTNAGNRLANERHVVIDVGGGSSDISVFSGHGKPLFMDSLYIGGKDVAESLIHYRITSQNRWQPMADLLRLSPDEAPRSSEDTRWTEMCQCLLIGRMSEPGGLEQLASECTDRNMRDLLGEIVALLSFATLYAVKLGTLPAPGHDLPKPKKVWVWYAGLGSQLFNLAPLASGILNRRDSARCMLENAVKKLAEIDGEYLKDVDVTFDWTYGKESVSTGALFARQSSRQLGTNVGDLQLRSVWWATAESGNPIWSRPYDDSEVRAITEETLGTINTAELFACLDVAVTTVGKAMFGRGWNADERQHANADERCRDHFVNGCQQIRMNERNAPPHPVRTVTDGMKKISICELIEPGVVGI